MKPRPIKIDGDVAYVTLTKGYVAVIDAADVPLVDGMYWRAKGAKWTVYVQRSERLGCGGKRRTILLHRAIMDPPADMQIDHIDGDGLNNRRENLRLATCAQNSHNQRINKNNQSGFKGVYWDKKNAKWVARIRLNMKRIFLGAFHTPEEAHAAYAAASEKFHGEFGRLE